MLNTLCTNLFPCAGISRCCIIKQVYSHLQVRSCDVCQRNNHKLQKASGSLQPIPVPSKIWCQVGMDLIGPMPTTTRGNRYIITLTDYFSKWAEAAPLPDKTAHGVAKFIYSVSSLHATLLYTFNITIIKIMLPIAVFIQYLLSIIITTCY